MTAAQRLDSLVTELAGHNLVLDTHLSTIRLAILENDRKASVTALALASIASCRIHACISELRNLAPGAGAATPPAAATYTLPVLTTAPASAIAPADTPSEPGRQDGSRGGTCADCGEYAAHLVPSIEGRWDYCRACADREIAEESPAAPDEDGDDCAYLYRDPDEELDELRDRRKEAQG